MAIVPIKESKFAPHQLRLVYTSVGKLPVHDEILNKNACGNFALFSIIKNAIFFPPPFYLHPLNLKLHPLTPSYTPNLHLHPLTSNQTPSTSTPLTQTAHLNFHLIHLYPLTSNYTPLTFTSTLLTSNCTPSTFSTSTP